MRRQQVKDNATGITAYIIYKEYKGDGTLVATADPETIVMERTKEDGSTVMSVCTPDLGITQKGYTTSQSSQVIMRTVVLDGEYKLDGEYSDVKAVAADGKTIVTTSCCHGQPVEFILIKL